MTASLARRTKPPPLISSSSVPSAVPTMSSATAFSRKREKVSWSHRAGDQPRANLSAAVSTETGMTRGSPASEGQLGPELHHPRGRDLEEVGGAHGVAGQEHEQQVGGPGQATGVARDQGAAAEEK